MNVWIIVAVIVGLLVIAGIVTLMTGLTIADEPEKISCSSCENRCTSDKNCGLETCGAISGGSCGCGG